VVRAQYHLELIDMVDELIYQRSIDDYKATHRAAFLGVVFNRSQGGKAEVKDLIGDPPERQRDVDERLRKSYAVAKTKGVRVPDGRR